MKIKSLLLGIFLLAGTGAYAHDFTATVNGQRLYFNISNKTRKTATVTFNGSIADKKKPSLSGIVEIPAKIRHDNVIYDVKAIGQKAFANANGLKGIVIPSGLESIGDFAFENCDSLSSVVFPGNPVSVGQGVFFKCNAITDVTLGGDWKTVDLSMFRWSRELKNISIPAKVEKIQGLKKLKGLQAISVDSNNKSFSSDNGMLYNREGSILFACPRAYTRRVVVKDGAKAVQEGALIDCEGVSAIDFPASLEKVSFRETSRMKGLKYIVMRAGKPIFTGFIDGSGKFFFQLANSKAEVIVNASDKNAYIEALATVAGEYRESKDGVQYEVSLDQLPSKKSIKGVKNFEKY